MDTHFLGLLKANSKNPDLEIRIIPDIGKAIYGVMICILDTKLTANGTVLRVKIFVLEFSVTPLLSCENRVYHNGSLSRCGPRVFKDILMLYPLPRLHPIAVSPSPQLRARFCICCQLCNSLPSECRSTRLMLSRHLINQYFAGQ